MNYKLPFLKKNSHDIEKQQKVSHYAMNALLVSENKLKEARIEHLVQQVRTQSKVANTSIEQQKHEFDQFMLICMDVLHLTEERETRLVALLLANKNETELLHLSKVFKQEAQKSLQAGAERKAFFADIQARLSVEEEQVTMREKIEDQLNSSYQTSREKAVDLQEKAKLKKIDEVLQKAEEEMKAKMENLRKEEAFNLKRENLRKEEEAFKLKREALAKKELFQVRVPNQVIQVQPQVPPPPLKFNITPRKASGS